LGNAERQHSRRGLAWSHGEVFDDACALRGHRAVVARAAARLGLGQGILARCGEHAGALGWGFERGTLRPSCAVLVMKGVGMRRVSILLVVLMMVVVAAPASAVTDWGTRAKAATGRVADTYASSSLSFTKASVGRTVNKVDGARVRVRTTDGVAAKVDVEADIWCANGSSKYESVTLTTKADSAWSYVTLYKPADKKRGQCSFDGSVYDWDGRVASPLEIQLQTTSY
jgi:hypothetical protein